MGKAANKMCSLAFQPRYLEHFLLCFNFPWTVLGMDKYSEVQPIDLLAYKSILVRIDLCIKRVTMPK